MGPQARALSMGRASCHLSFQAQLYSCAALYALTVVPAGTELLRLAACVFELGACVGVDEQAGLDSLETVAL
jgi:hypothetical protein